MQATKNQSAVRIATSNAARIHGAEASQPREGRSRALGEDRAPTGVDDLEADGVLQGSPGDDQREKPRREGRRGRALAVGCARQRPAAQAR
jgi:hypothetical protein